MCAKIFRFYTLTSVCKSGIAADPKSIWSTGKAREFKSREVAQRQNYNVISGFIRSLVLNTTHSYSSTPAPRDGWSGSLQSAPC